MEEFVKQLEITLMWGSVPATFVGALIGVFGGKDNSIFREINILISAGIIFGVLFGTNILLYFYLFQVSYLFKIAICFFSMLFVMWGLFFIPIKKRN